MSRKSRQHTVPQVYLRAFCDPDRPAGWPAKRPFAPSLWVHPRDLEGTPRRSATHNVAWARDIYNLRGDDPEHPWLEEVLSRLENSFAASIKAVLTGATISIQDRAILALFVGAQHERTEGMLKQRQSFFDEIFSISHQLQNARPHGPDEREDLLRATSDFGRRQFASFASAFAEVAGPHSFILENATPMPFITSDSPVSYRQLHADELLTAGIAPEWLFRGIPRSARHFFVFCPLSPKHAFVSSPFFPPTMQMERHPTTEPRLAFVMNELTRSSADTELYASSPDPYGPLKTVALAHDRRTSVALAQARPGLTIYTSQERYWLPTTVLMHGSGAHVLTGRLTFRTDDMRTLRAIASDGEMAEITYVSETGSGGMREARFVQVALGPDADSIIENGPIR